MKCLSIGYLIIVIIVLSIWAAIQGGFAQNIIGVLTTGAILYYVAGFFLPCDKK